jgi:predicted GNAT family acetyltransferase
VLTTGAIRVLRDSDRPEVDAVLDADPVASAFVAARVSAHGVSRWRLGAYLWGYAPSGRVESLCYSGANLVPVGASGAALRAFGDMAREQGRICSSIVGPADAVLAMWADLERDWGSARDVRSSQPLLSTSTVPSVPADPAVRRARMSDFDTLMPACVAMYTEEVGVSPLGWDGGATYRARVAELIRAGRSYVRIEDGEVVFKAELGAVSRQACQNQGVWVRPSWRGKGLATAGVAAVVTDALATIAPVVSLYVNDYNVAARTVYAHCGFTQVGTFATVLF